MSTKAEVTRENSTTRQRHDQGRLAATRTALTAWLSRPLASFHLLLAVFGLLTVIGLAMVLSASSVESYKSGHSVYTLFKKQVLFVLLGAVLCWVALRLKLSLVRRLAGPMILLSVALLAAVLVVGKTSGGSTGWFAIPGLGFQLQPVEFAKLSLAVWGAHVLVTKKALLHQFRHLIVPLLPVTMLLSALLMLQPDLGSTVSMLTVTVALLWFAGAPGKLFGAMIAGGIVGLVVLATGASYRLARVRSFLHPGNDPSGASYQALQAKYALADGGLFGRGLGQGSAKWNYLPNLHTDFIFALIGQELGLLGALLVLALYAMVAIVGLRIAARNVDPFMRLLAGSLTVWIVSQAAINIGYVVNLLPVTGLTLPMISYGGTSIVTTMIVFGLLANCARHEPEAVSALRTQGPGRFGKLLWLPAPEPYHPPARRKGGRPSSPPRPGGRGGASGMRQDRRYPPQSVRPGHDYRRSQPRRMAEPVRGGGSRQPARPPYGRATGVGRR
ncbi:MAG: putative lipid II flippase FtsW [Sciscionella sp.]